MPTKIAALPWRGISRIMCCIRQRKGRSHGGEGCSAIGDTLSTEDVALGYKQLLMVESAFRTLKTTLDIRPVYHRKDERIRSHVLLCWLALLLVRIAEVQTGRSWPDIRSHMQAMHQVTKSTPDGIVVQRTETTEVQREILRALRITEPPRILRMEPRTRGL